MHTRDIRINAMPNKVECFYFGLRFVGKRLRQFSFLPGAFRLTEQKLWKCLSKAHGSHMPLPPPLECRNSSEADRKTKTKFSRIIFHFECTTTMRWTIPTRSHYFCIFCSWEKICEFAWKTHFTFFFFFSFENIRILLSIYLPATTHTYIRSGYYFINKT